MALRPEDRYATPGALAEDLDRWLADEPVGAWREPWTVRARRWTRRHGHQVASPSCLLAGRRRRRRRVDLVRAQEYEIATRGDWPPARAELAAVSRPSQRARIRADRGRIGWTWAGLEDVKKAAALDTASRDLVELTDRGRRLPDGGATSGIPPSWPPGFNPGRLAFSPDGKVIAVARKRRTNLNVFPVVVETYRDETILRPSKRLNCRN